LTNPALNTHAQTMSCTLFARAVKKHFDTLMTKG